MLLQPGVGPIRAATYLPATAGRVRWGRLPCEADPPVLRIDPGTEVTIDTISHEGILEDQGRDPRAYFAEYDVPGVLDDAIALAASDHPRTFGVDGPHVVTGPIAVRGARPGDTLAMTVVETLPRVPYGLVSNRHGRGALPGEYPRSGEVFSVFSTLDTHGEHALMRFGPDDDRSVRFPVAPFLGIMGVATPGDRRLHTVPPGPHGGNLDIRLLTTGATLYLPVQVPEALAYVGDPHFCQGDGEVALTALEASLRVTLRFDVVPAAESRERFGPIAGPLAETPDHLVPVGLDPDLDVAVQECVRNAISLLDARYGMDRRHALAYLSAATDFDISQVVDLVKGVHARIQKADFTPPTGREAPASQQASALDTRVWRVVGDPLVPATGTGALDGHTVAVKDLFAVAGHRVGAGNPTWLDQAEVEARHADVVVSLLGAGAALRGIARTDELAYSLTGINAHYGSAPNPAAPGRVSGGSSSGSAAAVASGHASIGLGTDTGGSIRVPAAYQGLFGVRTTHGAISRRGVVGLAPSFDTVGWLTRDPITLRAVGRVLLADEESPKEVRRRPLELVLDRGLLALAEPAVRDAVSGFAARLGARDEALVDADLVERWRDIFVVRQAVEAWTEHGRWLAPRMEVLGREVHDRFASARARTPAETEAAEAGAVRARADIREAVGDRVLLLPATPTVAPSVSADPAAVRAPTLSLTCLAGLGGLPSVCLPLRTAAGLPCAAALLAGPGRDLDLLDLAVELTVGEIAEG